MAETANGGIRRRFQKPSLVLPMLLLNPVTEADAGIHVKPECPAELADAVLQLGKLSQIERQALGINGQKYLFKHFDIERLGEKLESLLSETIFTKRR